MGSIVITGVSGGMGSAAAAQFLKKGFDVWGLDVKEPVHAGGIRFVGCDLTDPVSVTEACSVILKEAGSVDAVIHMAGIYDLDSLIEMDEEAFRRIFEINLFGVYRLNRTILPMLKEGGRIVITTSELAPLDPLPFTGIYGITKTALEKYAEALRMELQLIGRSVIVIRPGAVDTGLLDVSTEKLDAFCEKTALYSYNAGRFRRIVDKVESRNIAPQVIAKIAYRAVTRKRPRFTYNANRNPLLRLLNLLPLRMQCRIIKGILKEKD